MRADTFAPGLTSGQLIAGDTSNRSVPFLKAQPVQGFSAVLPGPKPGTFLVMGDNGFGAKANSADFLLRFYAVQPDFLTAQGGSGQVFPVNRQTGEKLNSFTKESFIQLSDRASKVGFPIVAEQAVYPGSVAPTRPNGIPIEQKIKVERLLTGADFDPESFRQANDGTYWFGDEFGPFLLHVAPTGELLQAPIPLPNFLKLGGNPFVQSPDNPAFASLPNSSVRAAANLPSSRGFEGMALNASGTKLYAILEGALVPDSPSGRLLIHEFDLATQQYTGKLFSYQLESPNHNIGDLTAISDRELIAIERDNGQGNLNNPVFTNPAQFKRLYKIDINKVNREGFVEKKLLVDLLKIPDPNGIGGNGTTNGIFTFPFVTIENVLPLDNQTLLVINDNNYPFRGGRTFGDADNSEFIQIRLDRPLELGKRS